MDLATAPGPDRADQSVRRLRRARANRMIGGVAAGIGDHFGIDPNVVRIGFVILTLFSGVGALLYVAGWLLLPESDDPAEAAGPDGLGARAHPVLLFAGLVAVGVLSLAIFSLGPWWSPAHLSDLGGGLWLVLAVAAAALVLRARPVRLSLGRVLAVTVLALLSILVLVTAVVVGIVLSSGAPLTGGIGDRLWQPTSIGQIHSPYRTAVGSATVDLRQVPFAGTEYVTASVGIGRLEVLVPRGLTVSLAAHASVGNVVFDGGRSAFFGAGNGSRHLVLEAAVGIGQVELVRGDGGVVAPARPAPAPVPARPSKPSSAGPLAPAPAFP